MDACAEDDVFACHRCSALLPVVNGIVRPGLRLPADCQESDSKRREIAARNVDAATYDQWLTSPRNAVEIPPCLAAIRPDPCDVVIELGCGTGRLTIQYAAQVQRIVAVDFSIESLEILRRRLPAEVREHVLLLEADVSVPLPVASHAFSKVLAFEVLQHLPSTAARRRALAQAADLLIPGGTFVCTVYNWSKDKQRQARRRVGDDTSKEGAHATGIYYYNFDEPELRQLLDESGLCTDATLGLNIPIRGARFLGRRIVPINRLLAKTRFGLERAHVLMAAAHLPRH
jgi:SAM-dependent methyltransferase